MKIDLNNDTLSPGLTGKMQAGMKTRITSVQESDWKKIKEDRKTEEGRRIRKAESVENFDISEDV